MMPPLERLRLALQRAELGLQTGDDGGELGHWCAGADHNRHGRSAARYGRAAMTLDELKAEIAAGDIDTVLLALTDMQGRLQGKRLTAPWFLQSVVGHGAEGCNYLLAVDVDMNTVDGYAMSSWERGYGDFVMKPDLDTLCRVPWLEGTALCLADVEWEDGSPVVASPRQILRAPARRAWPSAAGRPTPAPSSSSWSSTTATSRRGTARYRGLDAGQPLQRRLLDARAPRASSRCCAASATR